MHCPHVENVLNAALDDNVCQKRANGNGKQQEAIKHSQREEHASNGKQREDEDEREHTQRHNSGEQREDDDKQEHANHVNGAAQNQETTGARRASYQFKMDEHFAENDALEAIVQVEHDGEEDASDEKTIWQCPLCEEDYTSTQSEDEQYLRDRMHV